MASGILGKVATIGASVVIVVVFLGIVWGLLPEDPFITYVENGFSFDENILKIVNYLLPIKEMILVTETFLTALLTIYGLMLIGRIAKLFKQ